MSALDKNFCEIMKQVGADETFKKLTPIKKAIWLLWDMDGFEMDAYSAADELAEKDAELNFYRGAFPNAARNWRIVYEKKPEDTK